jgi:hypothetical protein
MKKIKTKNYFSELNELEILDIMNNFGCGKFLGVFGCDELVNITKQGYLIVNTDPSYQAGTHWISIAIKKTSVYYYDPLNMNFWFSDANISNFLMKLGRDLYINNVSIQTLNSPYCGQHCVVFCYLMMNRNTSFRQFLNIFSPHNIDQREKLSLELFKNIKQKAIRQTWK